LLLLQHVILSGLSAGGWLAALVLLEQSADHLIFPQAHQPAAATAAAAVLQAGLCSSHCPQGSSAGGWLAASELLQQHADYLRPTNVLLLLLLYCRQGCAALSAHKAPQQAVG
jgi:acetyl esterase/lipase